jgi:hypothetical protein
MIPAGMRVAAATLSPGCAPESVEVPRETGPVGEPCPPPDCPAEAHSGGLGPRRVPIVGEPACGGADRRSSRTSGASKK